MVIVFKVLFNICSRQGNNNTENSMEQNQPVLNQLMILQQGRPAAMIFCSLIFRCTEMHFCAVLNKTFELYIEKYLCWFIHFL